ncbi:unnamed protein product [Enterobius vermicularis]|uniref:RING-type domain-containing protein n=1 Tax=Enterobius vermicularis TaxID=51028 RepID=A0A0N4V4F7_ENTVE|nr:unnamed protein product [Enterobius vermicularis]
MGTTFVETVNINLEDFSESFLTCATCLCTYDQDKRKAKLLPCSHTVCLRCLTQMEQISQKEETNVIRCPLCREITTLPASGVSALPNSFLINQLFDLMRKQRKDVVPNCSAHPHQQLMYCEACDLVFCTTCRASLISSCAEHNVVPFSVALKRISEIVVHKTRQCVANLDKASKNVNLEIDQLDKNVDRIVEELNNLFQEVCQTVENRRRELVDSARVLRDEKRKVLLDQLELIDSHRKRLERELETSQFDVREMSYRTKKVTEATEQAVSLMEPKENAFLKLHTEPKKLVHEFKKLLNEFGTISGSSTFPGLCTLELTGPSSSHIRTYLVLNTYSADGRRRNSGGDPITIKVTLKKNSLAKTDEYETIVEDQDDGTYRISFKTCIPGDYLVCAEIFDRPVKNSPFLVFVSNHHNPIWQFGSPGVGKLQLNQPTKICQDEKGNFYILDTGNNRIKVLDVCGDYVKDVTGAALSEGSTVGLATLPTGEILTLNWRTKEVVKSDFRGTPLQTMTFSEFGEPVDLCVDSHGRILIADAANSKVFVFDTAFRPLFSFSTELYASNSSITCVSIGMNDEIIVGTCSSLLLFDGRGEFLREIHLGEPSSRACMMAAACAVCPSTGTVLVAVIDVKKNRAHLAVCQYKGPLLFTIDSYGSKLRHPCGICVAITNWKNTCFVVDSANCCVKAFQFC